MVRSLRYLLVFLYFFLAGPLSARGGECVSRTGNDATIVFPATLAPANLVAGDVISAHTQGGLCVGSIVWSPGTARVMTVWGDNEVTPAKDGLANGESISFSISHMGIPYPGANLTFVAPAGALYSPNAIKIVGSIQIAVSALILAPGTLVVNPESYNFGTVAPGASASVQVTLSHQGGTQNLSITQALSSNGKFTVSPLTATLAPNTSKVFTIIFRPGTTGSFQSGTITFKHDGSGSYPALSVRANGDRKAYIKVSPISITFGSLGIGRKKSSSITVTNPGGSRELSISNVVSSNTSFTVSPRSATIPPNGSAVFTVTFAPTTVGLRTGTVSFVHNANSGQNMVTVSGTGVRLSGSLEDIDVNGPESLSNLFDQSALPSHYELSPVYPNPFNPETHFVLSMVESQDVRIQVYDVRGSRVATLHRGNLEAGVHSFTFQAGDLPSGLYFMVAQASTFHIVRSATLIK